MKKWGLCCFMIMLLVGCQKEEVPYQQSSLSDKIQSVTDEYNWSLVLEDGVNLDDLVVTYAFETGEVYEQLPYLFELEIIDQKVEEDIVLFEDFQMSIKYKNDSINSVVLSFHDGHFVSVDEHTYAIATMPFTNAVEKEMGEEIIKGNHMSGILFLPQNIKKVSFEIWNLPMFHKGVKVSLKKSEDNELILDALKQSEISATYAQLQSDDEVNWYLEPSAYSDFKMMIETDRQLYQYQEKMNDIMLFNRVMYDTGGPFISEHIANLYKDILPHNEDYTQYLKPILFENEDILMTSLPTPVSDTYCEVTQEDIAYWLNQGLMLKDEVTESIIGCVLFVDDADNLFELCNY